ncbi:hypothetical protein NS220_15950 [Microbacterium testaceum]|uniref:Uncharacterized protein n=1 Tax=Microbacterium testaceum TaxID=2033 RepID=A0A147ETE8_MICTE|nr:hypothetical protein [Microbacterium testaceum]KTR89348.1 hypothetical protein NS220_15950 [Microbacterium testaceum]
MTPGGSTRATRWHPNSGIAAIASTAPSGPVQVTVLAGDENDAWEQHRHAAALEELAPAVTEGRIAIASGASWADAAVADARSTFPPRPRNARGTSRRTRRPRRS